MALVRRLPGRTYGIIVKGAAVIEKLGQVVTVFFDKTGTLTVGTPESARSSTVAGVQRGELLRSAASVDEFSATRR